MGEKGKKILIILIVIMGMGLAGLLVTDRVENYRLAEQYRLRAEEQEPDQEEKQRREVELETLEEEYEKKISGAGTAAIIFTDLDERIATEIAPIMEEHGYEGVLVFSEGHLPGQEGRMTADQVRELTAKGWICCAGWRTGDTIENVNSAQREIEALGASDQGVVYFEEGAYSSSYDQELAAVGFTIAIHHGEEHMLVTGPEDTQVWHPGAVGLMGKEPRFRLEDAVTEKQNILFTVGFEKEDEMYNQGSFLSLLNYFDKYGERNEMYVMMPSEARVYQEEIRENAEGLQAEYDAKRAELEEKIEELEKKLEQGRAQR